MPKKDRLINKVYENREMGITFADRLRGYVSQFAYLPVNPSQMNFKLTTD